MLIRRFVILLCLCLALTSYAQSIDEIRKGKDYYWGEGEGLTINEARNIAYARMAASIGASVEAVTTDEDVSVTANGQTTQQSVQSMSTTVISRVKLSNYETMTISEKPGECHVLLFISKSQYAEQQARQQEIIGEYVKAGKVAEQHRQIDDALRNYYWALVLDRYGDYHVKVDFGDEAADCQTLLPVKIKSVLSQITAVPDATERSATGSYPLMVRFNYAGDPLSTVTFHYFDGERQIGPVSVCDGRCEVELIKLPIDQKVEVRYEYRFDDEMDNPDLTAALRSEGAPMFDATRSFSIKVNERKGTVMAGKDAPAALAEEMRLIAAEAVRNIPRKEMAAAEPQQIYTQAMRSIEQAISHQDASLADDYFSPEGYDMFCRMLHDPKARIKLESAGQQYEYVDDGLGQVLARPCRVVLTYGMRRFTEKLVFRFDKRDNKICSMAYMLTDKAEADIFNSKAKWSDVSRYTILEFMENYQTAYAQRNLNYIRQIFSDRAVIILGTMLKPLMNEASMLEEGQTIHLDGERKDVRYTRYTKDQYLRRLERQFKDRDYIHLRFEDNVTGIINSQRIREGDAFAIQIRQIYESPHYSDQGYLTLLLNMQEEHPRIEVRLWQPEKDKDAKVDPDQFFTHENFNL